MKSFISLISGGIDSPVAAYMIGRLGYRIIPIHFNNSPFSSDLNVKKAEEVTEKLKEYIQIDELIIIPHGKNLEEISKNCERKYTCVLCRRMMFRISERICKKTGSEGIVTGEFLGSKASQTLRNMEVISQSIETPLIRPLIGMDKNEITDKGREIGTFYQGFSPAGCCSVVPDKPSTKADLKKILEEEEKIDIKGMVERTINHL